MTETIAILHYAGPPGIGGVEATIAAHIRLLADDGYGVRVIVGQGDRTDGREDLHVLPLLGSRHPRIDAANESLSRGEITPLFHELVAEIENQLATALAGCAAALIHNVHTLHKNLAFTAALHRLHESGSAPRMLAWAHDFAWRDPLYLPELHDGWPWNLLREAWPGVQYVAVSEDRRAILADVLGVAEESVAVVTPGVDVARLMKLDPMTHRLVERHRLLDAAPLLLLPARITRRKNIEGALRIVAALRDAGMQPLLVVTGPPGPHNPTNAAYLAELQTLRAELDAPVLFLYESYVDDAGRPCPVTDAMIADWLSLADGLLFPSRSEGFGMPVIEAALRQVPIFCADIAPFREIASDDALRFALDESPAAVAERIAAALRRDSRYRLRRRVRAQYTWQAIYRRSIAPLLADPSGRAGA
jgi:mannosylglucosylglycerate synthase